MVTRDPYGLTKDSSLTIVGLQVTQRRCSGKLSVCPSVKVIQKGVQAGYRPVPMWNLFREDVQAGYRPGPV